MDVSYEVGNITGGKDAVALKEAEKVRNTQGPHNQRDFHSPDGLRCRQWLQNIRDDRYPIVGFTLCPQMVKINEEFATAGCLITNSCFCHAKPYNLIFFTLLRRLVCHLWSQ